MFVKSTRFKQLCQLLLSLIVALSFFRVGFAPTCILHHSQPFFSRLSLRKCCCQTHKAPINMKLVLRLEIKVCLDCVATEHILKFLECFGVFRFPFEFSGHQLTQFASRFLIVSGLHESRTISDGTEEWVKFGCISRASRRFNGFHFAWVWRYFIFILCLLRSLI